MNTLEQLKTMPDNQIQNWLRHIDPEDMKMAIPGISEEIRKCIYRNMSENAGKVLKVLAENNRSMKNNGLKTSIRKLEMALNGA